MKLSIAPRKRFLSPGQIATAASLASATGRTITAVLWLLVCNAGMLHASDHADPIDPFNRERLEGGITDLFVFPVLKDDQPAFPYQGNKLIPLGKPLTDIARAPLTDEQRAEIDAIVIILCVRRQLTQTGSLMLEPYTYRIRMDLDSPLEFAQVDADQMESGHSHPGSSGYHDHGGATAAGMPKRPTPHEAFLRYGGRIEKPNDIEEDVQIEFELTGTAKLKDGFPKYIGDATSNWTSHDRPIRVTSGVYDDPFIFPAFFGTNVVAMAVRIPVALFPKDQTDFLIWATSHKGDRQVDHVGRSLRTQNPRFEMLNVLHPREHVNAITAEHEHPGLLRDIALRLNFASMFAFRRWDFVPDVLVFTTRYPVGFPNGRLLTDDVAAQLAQFGDPLLFELSYQHNNGTWPRQTANDKDFASRFPYLADPWPDTEPPAPPRLSQANIRILYFIAASVIAILVLENWLVARWYYYRKLRRRYL